MASLLSKEAYAEPAKLEEQAASTALHEARDESRRSQTTSSSVLDESGKLSSASAAMSLKYARAQDLPSFPSKGLNMSSAGAAASLADSNKKSFEYWKPGQIPSANKAAMLAKDYEMDPLWHPELSKAGSKAALIAQRETPEVNVYRAPTTAQGQSAASQALGMKQPGAITNRDVSAGDHRKALLAATASMRAGRARAGSAPDKPMGNAAWALKAATSTKPQVPAERGEFASGDPGFEAARVQNMARNNVSRQMYTSNPPVSIEVEERNRNAMLRASAIAMARKMYAIQQEHIDAAKGTTSDSRRAATRARNRGLSESSGSEAAIPNQYEGLEEAARRLAQERLAKLNDEHAEYRQYYGQSSAPARNRLSLRARRRTSDDDDDEEARRIAAQMSIFKSKLAEVDTKQRQADRDALLAAAHKNVTKRLNDLDDKVFQETGKASPRQMELWEQQARAKAQKDSDDRMANHGKVHIGGGQYLDQSEVDAIARARLQPTLDEISEKAAAQRARDEEIRLEQERIKAEQEKEKQRLVEEKRLRKQQEDAEKIRRATAAAEERQRLQLEKAERRKQAEAAGTSSGRFSRIFGQTPKAATVGETSAEAATLPFAAATTAGGVDVADGVTVHDAVTVQPVHDAVTEPHEHAEPVEEVKYATPGPIEGGPLETVEFEHAEEDQALPEDAPVMDEQESADRVDPVEAEEKAKVAETTIPATLTSNESITNSAVPASPASPTKRDSKVRSWFSRFRSGSKAQEDLATPAFGDRSTTTPVVAPTMPTTTEDSKVGSESEKDVALAGRGNTQESDDMYGPGTSAEPVSPVHDTEGTNTATEPTTGLQKSPSISSLSSYSQKGASSVAYSQQPSVTARPGTSTSDYGQESESEQRGRKGFRQRLLGRITATTGRHEKPKEAAPPAPQTSHHNAQPERQSEAAGEGKSVESVGNPGAPNDIYAAVTVAPEAHNGVAEQRSDQQAVAQESTEGPISPQPTDNTENEDDFEEARDTFEEETLSPPPKLSSAKTAGSPNSRERSRFTEEL